MSGEPIGAGDPVECIVVAPPRPDRPPSGFKLGAIYTVETVGPDSPCDCGAPPHGGITVREITHPLPLGQWCINSFRPLGTRRGFEQFLNTVKQPCDVSEPSELVPATA